MQSATQKRQHNTAAISALVPCELLERETPLGDAFVDVVDASAIDAHGCQLPAKGEQRFVQAGVAIDHDDCALAPRSSIRMLIDTQPWHPISPGARSELAPKPFI